MNEQLVEMIADATTKHMSSVLDQNNERLDYQIDRLQKMTEQELEELREKKIARRDELGHQRGEWLRKGHGVYTEICDEADFFRECKHSRLVCIQMFRPSTWRCELVDKHLHKLAADHLECKFLKINAEKIPFLVERLRIMVIPTLVLVIAGKVAHQVVGFDELGGTDDFTTEKLAQVLHQHNVISLTEAQQANFDSDDEDVDRDAFKITVQPKRNKKLTHDDYDDLSD